MPSLFTFLFLFLSVIDVNPPALCAGCALQPFQTGTMGVTVTVNFGPACGAGTCTGTSPECSETPCHLQTLTYKITNTSGQPQQYTYYTGSFPVLQGQTETLGPGTVDAPAWVEKQVGKATDPVDDFGCSGQRALVTQGLSTAGVECTKCQ